MIAEDVKSRYAMAVQSLYIPSPHSSAYPCHRMLLSMMSLEGGRRERGVTRSKASSRTAYAKQTHTALLNKVDIRG
jgi:hypothetical protein